MEKKMNKTIMTFVLASILLLGIGFVTAETPARDGTGEYHDEIVAAGGMNGTGLMAQVQEGTYMNQAGEQIQIQRGEGNRLQLRVRDVEAHSDLEITSEQVQERVRLMTALSNGRNAEIKVMPNTASETALERLRLRICTADRNCSIELKEVGQGNQTRLAYEVQTQRESRVFGLFKAQMQVRAQVDAENGEVIRVGKPWWAFLATEPEEQAEEQ
jgi:hypothetical protein